jgi:hypothetical protein
MICPVCKAEYRDYFTECRDCNVELVEELPEDEFPEPETHPEFETIEVEFEAGAIGLIKSVFDQEEITYFFQKDDSLFFTSGGPILMVRKDQVEKAKEILDDLLDQDNGLIDE